MAVAERQANSSNNTLFADSKGEIAYLHPQFVPIRDDRFDYTKAVDGADPTTDWKGLHKIATLPNVINPPVGWAKNTNDWPWQAAGPDSPKAKDYPRYMDQAGPNARGTHADLVLTGKTGFTPESLRAAAYDSYLPAFAKLIPQLVAAWDALPASDARRAKLAAPVALLKGWDYRWSAGSEPTALAVFWGDTLWKEVGSFARAEAMNVPDYIGTKVTPEAKLDALVQATDRLTRDFGDWRVAWGRINRFQRLDDSIDAHFDDTKPSIPGALHLGTMGLARLVRRPALRQHQELLRHQRQQLRRGGRVRPPPQGLGGHRGRESGNPASKHFNDQAQRYAARQSPPGLFLPAGPDRPCGDGNTGPGSEACFPRPHSPRGGQPIVGPNPRPCVGHRIHRDISIRHRRRDRGDRNPHHPAPPPERRIR